MTAQMTDRISCTSYSSIAHRPSCPVAPKMRRRSGEGSSSCVAADRNSTGGAWYTVAILSAAEDASGGGAG